MLAFLLLAWPVHLTAPPRLEGWKMVGPPVNTKPMHILQVGYGRTGTTFQFQALCMFMFLLLTPEDRSKLDCNFQNVYRNNDMFERAEAAVYKVHTIDAPVPQSVWVFATCKDGIIQGIGSAPPKEFVYVQEINKLQHKSLMVLNAYRKIFNVTTADMQLLLEYFFYWEMLRMCCGVQMSNSYRLRFLLNQSDYQGKLNACHLYNITTVEQFFMQTKLYRMTQPYERVHRINSPSLGEKLTGNYCQGYADAVVKYKLTWAQWPPK